MKIYELIVETQTGNWISENELENYIPAEAQGDWVNLFLRKIVTTASRLNAQELNLGVLVPQINKWLSKHSTPINIVDGIATRENNVTEIKWQVDVDKGRFNEDGVNSTMRANEFVTEKKASSKTCNSHKKLGRSMQSSCVSQGLRPHQSNHTAGTGTQGKKGSGIHLQGTKRKSVRYNGDVKDYSGKRKKK